MEELRAERNKSAVGTSKDNIIENDSDEDENEKSSSKLNAEDEDNDNDDDEEDDDDDDDLIGPSLDYQDKNSDESVKLIYFIINQNLLDILFAIL